MVIHPLTWPLMDGNQRRSQPVRSFMRIQAPTKGTSPMTTPFTGKMTAINIR